MDARTAGTFNRLAMMFAAGTVFALGLAVLLPRELRPVLIILGLAIVVAAYVAGGGLSIRTQPSTPIHMSTTFARTEADIRFRDRNVNWNLIYAGVILGAPVALAGVASLFV